MLLTNPNDELRDLELMFRGMQDRDGKLIQVGQPIMNSYGINTIIGTAQGIVSQVTIMANLQEKDILLLIDYLGDYLARILMVNRKTFCLVNVSARDIIYHNVMTRSYIAMRRAFEEGERKFWKGSQQEISYRTPQAGKDSALKSILGWVSK
jgi:hypothetical protein